MAVITLKCGLPGRNARIALFKLAINLSRMAFYTRLKRNIRIPHLAHVRILDDPHMAGRAIAGRVVCGLVVEF